jgi:hypothetical protein
MAKIIGAHKALSPANGGVLEVSLMANIFSLTYNIHDNAQI